MTTLREVANIAGVNISTISRFLSGDLNVKPGTEQRIMRAMERTNYHPNIVARSLRKGKTDTLAVIVPDIYQPGISGIVAGIDERINDTEYTLVVLMTANDAAREQKALRTLLQMMIDGIILVGHAFDSSKPVETVDDDSNRALNAIKEANIPVTFVSRNYEQSSFSEVCPDQENGAYQLTLHLLERGYRSIGMIVGSINHPSDTQKLKGYKRALQTKNVDFRKELVAEGFYRRNQVSNATSQLIRQSVDAIFCSTDDMAVAALKHVRQAGLSVPGDMAIAGYGGSNWADLVTPKLTTVDVHLENLGSAAADLLLSLIEGKSDPPILDVLPVHLRVGESA